MGLRGHARTGHASSPGPPIIDPRRYVFSYAMRPPVSVRPIASSQSACSLGAPPSPSMPAAASTLAWRADWAAAHRHSWRPLDARPLAPLKGGHNGAAATTASISIATAAATATTSRHHSPAMGFWKKGRHDHEASGSRRRSPPRCRSPPRRARTASPQPPTRQRDRRYIPVTHCQALYQCTSSTAGHRRRHRSVRRRHRRLLLQACRRHHLLPLVLLYRLRPTGRGRSRPTSSYPARTTSRPRRGRRRRRLLCPQSPC
jgi:hypothetical protein